MTATAAPRSAAGAPAPRDETSRRFVRSRALHPLAWWGWALALAAAAMRTTNPLLLLLLLSVVAWVVVARRTDAPWARSFTVALWIGAFLVTFRIVLAALFGMRLPGTVLFTLPSAGLPEWAAGVSLGGAVTLELLAQAFTEGLRLAVIVACFGAANALANPQRLLRSLPAALYEAGVAVTVALSFAPQTVMTVARIREARRLRGRATRGLSGLRGLALPVLEGALERSVDLAASMDARGYGRRGAAAPAARRLATAATLTGLLGVAVGAYAALDAGAPNALGMPVLAAGSLFLAMGLVVAGRRVERTRYRPEPWRSPEWLTVGCGMAAALALAVVASSEPTALEMPLFPITWPAVPLLAVAGIGAALLAGLLTPRPPMLGAATATVQPT